MDDNLAWVESKKIEKTIKALENNNMKGYFVENSEELLVKIQELIDDGDTVGCGGSMTLFESGVIDFLRSGEYNFLDRYEANLTPQDIKEIYRKSFSADVYFSSSNAITENGELYNVDGLGNRVAAMIYGPDKVIVVAGINKIVKDIDEAVCRNKFIAAPANAKRLNMKTPCLATGECVECNSPDRICCEYTVIKKQRIKDRIHVIFVNEKLGY